MLFVSYAGRRGADEVSTVRSPGRPGRAIAVAAASYCLALAGCSTQEYESTAYYERQIAPILNGSCSRSATGSLCHAIADEQGNALGNLATTSYELLNKRRDLLVDYGPYGVAGLLVKALPPEQLRLVAWDGDEQFVTTDVPHVGGSLLDLTAASTIKLDRWLKNGAADNNLPPPPPAEERTPCVEKIGADSLFDPSADPVQPDYPEFRDSVGPMLVRRCAAGNCHGGTRSTLYLTCGKSAEQQRWNYFSASDYVAADAETSELLRRTLHPNFGGTFHEGGWVFESREDPDYQALLAWATAKGGPTHVPEDAGFDFFAKRVQPLLAKRGCMLLPCHAAAGFNDFHLRAGSNGHFGLPATRSNYTEALQFLALESPDPSVSRLIRKNLTPDTGGIRHRGGALLADTDLSACDRAEAENGPLDEQKMGCVIQAWAELERSTRSESVAPLSAIVYVTRPISEREGAAQDFEEYRPGADLRRVAAAFDASGRLGTSGQSESLLALCGLDAATADVRRPQVSWDGTAIAFSARSAANEPWAVYAMDAEGQGCGVEPAIAAAAVDENGDPVSDNGELVHNFDPSFAPDGRLVFVSTRGNTRNTKNFDYAGPQRTPADPSKLNANLYVFEAAGKIRQLTFLLNQELLPSFKANGQVLFTTEKRVPGFYQLAGRRINLDGGDYHPLFGQRVSVGHAQVTDLVQLADLNFAAIFSDPGAAAGAGTLAVINRSLGPDTVSPKDADYAVDPGQKAWGETKFFQHSLTFPDADATGHVGQSQRGAYRNVSPLPNGEVLVSYAGDATDLETLAGGFDIVVMDPLSGQRETLAGLDVDGLDELWPAAVYGRVSRGVFESSPADPTGSAVIFAEDDGSPRTDRAELTFLDFPLIASLMFQNTRGGRHIEPLSEFELWESLPPKDVTSLNDPSPFIVDDAFGKVYARRRLLGKIPLFDDGSARLQVPGGLPLVFGAAARLADESDAALHHQLEETQYYPGEWVTLSFRRELFDGFCGGCHGSVTGQETDIAVKPDILTKASEAKAVKARPTVLVGTERGSPSGPPFP